MKERLRRFESSAEKYGGGVIAVIGAVSLNYPAVALGLAIMFIGIARTPEAKKKGS
jgi:hypothetical protein